MVDQRLIGRLQTVPARELWRHEAIDFTRWLLDNAVALSDVLSLDLELDAAEHAVGDFSLDLIGRDRLSGDLVIVENQLEPSDHTPPRTNHDLRRRRTPHTWSGLHPRSDPRIAVRRSGLNERTDEATRFFAVEVKVMRIGDSPYAPLLSLAVQPNDWGKQVRNQPAQRSGTTWSPANLMPAVRAESTPAVAEEVGALMAAHEGLGADAGFYYGTARGPSVTATMAAGSLRTQPWSIFTHRGVVWTLNLDWIHKQGRVLPADYMETLAAEFNDLPGLAEAFESGRSIGWRRRPSITAGPLFTPPRRRRSDRIRDGPVVS